MSTPRWTPLYRARDNTSLPPGLRIFGLEYRTCVRVGGLRVSVHVARIVRADGVRLSTRGWFAHVGGLGRTVATMIANYRRLEERFGSDVHGVRGYGRTREEALLFLRRALLNGWMCSGQAYMPPQFDSGYTSEYDV